MRCLRTAATMSVSVQMITSDHEHPRSTSETISAVLSPEQLCSMPAFLQRNMGQNNVRKYDWCAVMTRPGIER